MRETSLTSGTSCADNTATIATTIAVRTGAGRVRSRPSTAAAPVASSMNSGTRRKLKNRGTMYVQVSQNATTVTTTGTQSTSRGNLDRRSGLDPATAKSTRLKSSDCRLGRTNESSSCVNAGTSVWSIGAVASQRVSMRCPYSARELLGMSSRCGAYQATTIETVSARARPTGSRSSRLASRTAHVATYASTKWGSV